MTKKQSSDPKPLKGQTDLGNEINRLMTTGNRKDMNLTLADQQFLIRYLDLRDNAMLEDIKGFIEQAILADKEAICTTVVNLVSAQLAEVLAPVLVKLESLENSLIAVNGRLTQIEQTQNKEDSIIHTIQNRLDEKRVRIEKLENIAVLHTDEIKAIDDRVQKLEKK